MEEVSKKRKLSMSSEGESDASLMGESMFLVDKTLQKNFKALQKTKDREERKAKAIASVFKLLNISEDYSNVWHDKIPSMKKYVNIKDVNVQSEENEKPEVKDIVYFKGQLRPYQVEGVTWMTTLYIGGMNGILADEMGLGKTVQIIALFSHLLNHKVTGPYLIVAPLSTIPNWISEFERFAPIFPVVVLQGDRAKRNSLKEKIGEIHQVGKLKIRPVVLISYQIVLREESFLKTVSWKYVVVDEAQRIKNHESKLGRTLRELKSDNRLLLTGTPLQNNMVELWSLLNFIMPKVFTSVDTFSSLFILEDFQETNLMSKMKENNTIIETIHKVLAPFMLRRLKKEVLTDFVPKKEVLVYCPLTELQHDIYHYTVHYSSMQKKAEEIDQNAPRPKRRCTIKVDADGYLLQNYSTAVLEQNLSVLFPQTKPEHKNWHYYKAVKNLNILMSLRKIVDHPFLLSNPYHSLHLRRFDNEMLITESGKMLVLDAMLQKLKAGGHKVLIFSNFVIMLNLIEEYMLYRKYQFCSLVGDDSLEERQNSIAEFNNNPDIFVFLISTRAGGLGLNLTAADTVIFYDRDWNPQVDNQAQDRCHRIGQTKPVMIYTLVTKNTIDEKIIHRGDMKRRLEKLVIKEGKFQKQRSQKKEENLETVLKELFNERKPENIIRPNGFIFSDEELETLLDRTELLQQMEEFKKTGKVTP